MGRGWATRRAGRGKGRSGGGEGQWADEERQLAKQLLVASEGDGDKNKVAALVQQQQLLQLKKQQQQQQ